MSIVCIRYLMNIYVFKYFIYLNSYSNSYYFRLFKQDLFWGIIFIWLIFIFFFLFYFILYLLSYNFRILFHFMWDCSVDFRIYFIFVFKCFCSHIDIIPCTQIKGITSERKSGSIQWLSWWPLQYRDIGDEIQT